MIKQSNDATLICLRLETLDFLTSNTWIFCMIVTSSLLENVFFQQIVFSISSWIMWGRKYDLKKKSMFFFNGSLWHIELCNQQDYVSMSTGLMKASHIQ